MKDIDEADALRSRTDQEAVSSFSPTAQAVLLEVVAAQMAFRRSRATDIAWAAGLFEGEGSFAIPRAGRTSARLDLIDQRSADRVRSPGDTSSALL